MNDVDLRESKAYLKNLETAKDSVIKVGVNSDTGYTYKSGATVQEVAGKHEFGIGVPRRSFLRVPFLLKAKEIEKFTQLQFKKVIDGRKALTAMGLIGVKAENISKEAFETGGYSDWQDISDKTKNKKGSSGVLIDTGVLRSSITSVVV